MAISLPVSAKMLSSNGAFEMSVVQVGFVLVHGSAARLCLSHLSDFVSYLGVTLCRQLNLYTYFRTSVLRKPFRMVVT